MHSGPQLVVQMSWSADHSARSGDQRGAPAPVSLTLGEKRVDALAGVVQDRECLLRLLGCPVRADLLHGATGTVHRAAQSEV